MSILRRNGTLPKGFPQTFIGVPEGDFALRQNRRKFALQSGDKVLVPHVYW